MERKTNRLEIRLTSEQKELIHRAAELEGESLTAFILDAGEIAASRVLARAALRKWRKTEPPSSSDGGSDRIF